jgi:hypothetical protein
MLLLAVAGALASGLLEPPCALEAQAREHIAVTLAASESLPTTRRDSTPPRLTNSGATLRLEVSLATRLLSVLVGEDTVFQAPIGVARGVSFAFAGRKWEFQTPRGERRVVRKMTEPVWVPPDWHYAETARDYGLRLTRLPQSGFTLSTGERLVIRNNVVGIISPASAFAALPIDEHIVFDGRLFIPPLGTLNRRVVGDLGRYALDLGHGYMIHGTSDEASIGQASTHGCIRVRNDDIVWLYQNVPVGARVVIR